MADNTVDEARPGWIVFTFDARGPALVEIDGALHVIGVSAYNEGPELCRYGSREHYARVSDALGWIEGTMSGAIEATAEARGMRYESGADGQIRVTREELQTAPLSTGSTARLGAVVDALVAAMNDGSVEARDGLLELFSPEFLARRRRAGDPVTGVLDFLRAAIEARGPIVRLHDLPREGLLRPDSPYPMQPVVFHLRDGMPGYFGIALDDAGRIVHLSLFVQRSICADRERCTQGRTLSVRGSPAVSRLPLRLEITGYCGCGLPS